MRRPSALPPTRRMLIQDGSYRNPSTPPDATPANVAGSPATKASMAGLPIVSFLNGPKARVLLSSPGIAALSSCPVGAEIALTIGSGDIVAFPPENDVRISGL